MIWESCYWKDDLLRTALRLRRRQSQRRWSEASLANVEKDLFIGFYSVRKLMDANKLSDSSLSMSISITEHSGLEKSITNMNWHRLDELYDLENPRPGKLGLRALCNQIVHSYVFVTVLNDKNQGLDGIMIASDREKSSRLYQIPVDEIVRVFEIVGNDYPNQREATWDSKLGDYVVHQEMVLD
ncbi:hypothetical protein KBA39_05690 [Myxococcota bacterium]|nr:hypothetical protein [Myxococcota bacterium]